MKKLIFANREWLKYRYYLLSKTFWAKMHGYAATVHDYLLRVYKSTRLKLVKFLERHFKSTTYRAISALTRPTTSKHVKPCKPL